MRNDSGMAMDSAGARSRSGDGAVMGSEQQQVLDALASLNGKPIESLSAPDARKQPTPTDAVLALLKKEGKPTTPEAVGSVVNRTIPGPGGALPIRIYTPAGSGTFPVILYFHGGGFVIATNDTYDGSARALTNATKAILVSVEYRKAPEHKFPAAHDDALAAWKWVVANATNLRGDTAHIAIAGESAGGNLAIATTVSAKAMGLAVPVAILAVYPVTQGDTTTPSYTQNATAKPLNRAMMTWFFEKYTRSPADAKDPRLNLLTAELKGLPPTTIITAQFDPLRSDGDMLAERLKAAGVDVEIRNFDGVAHEFFGQGAVVPAAREAVAFAAGGLRKQLMP
ncbi:MAG: alpha/beta hydrolase [Gemmatimonadaceae bacterium]|nr:alpha/beta hydrolase [Gemmatimonadaceae bacterium]